MGISQKRARKKRAPSLKPKKCSECLAFKPSVECFPIAVVDDSNASASLQNSGDTGTISVLSQRAATVWNPIEELKHPWPRSLWQKRVVSFDTVDEAKDLVKRWEESFRTHSWINNHLQLPPEIGLMLHEYVAFRPSPVFFFAEGDLWISMKWPIIGSSEVVNTILAARRRTSGIYN